jgi:hypothetical protein
MRTGAAWFGYADTNDSMQAGLFAGYWLGHLRRQGVEVEGMVVQTDNGSEYIGHVEKRSGAKTLFEEVVEWYTRRRPEQIFPGAKTSQSDVEAFHALVESELYEVEDLSTERLLLGRARTYQVYFNLFRKTLWKGAKTPAMIVAEAGANIRPEALTLPPIRLETIPLEPLLRLQTLSPGNDVPNLVTFSRLFP